MPYPEVPGNPEASQEDTMILADRLCMALFDRTTSEPINSESLDAGVWALMRTPIPVDKITELFEIRPDDGIVLGAEVVCVIEEEQDIEGEQAVELIHVDVEITSQTIFNSELCTKLELWEVYVTSKRLSTVYVEYSHDGHRLPLRPHPEDDADVGLAYAIEQGLAFRNLSPDDMKHLERLRQWLAE